jgi:hypothetical protein
MEKNKYYVPSVEEFHVGFEYEYRTNGDDWVKHTVHTKADLAECIDDLEEKDNIIRVKHLDREDIESFGFEYDNILNDKRLFFFKDFTSEKGIESCGLIYVPQTNWVLLYTQLKQVEGILQGGYVIELPENKITITGGTRFCGTIKNKSELKRILTQIGVI